MAGGVRVCPCRVCCCRMGYGVSNGRWCAGVSVVVVVVELAAIVAAVVAAVVAAPAGIISSSTSKN